MSRDTEGSGAEERFGDVLAAYLEAADAGWAPPPAKLLARYPDLAPELQAFFANDDRVARLTESLRPPSAASAPASAPTVSEGSGATAPPPEWGKGHVLGDYEVLGEIARGGMGVVYRARQISANRPVALKMILTGPLASPAEVRRFRDEAEAVANLDHPHIVSIYQVGEHE